LHMAVKAVVNDIELAIGEPLEERLVRPLKGRVPVLEPVEFSGLIVPELSTMLQRPFIEGLIIVEAFRLHIGGDIGNITGRRKLALLGQNRVCVFKTRVTHDGIPL
jgi:hypothetical protein